MTIDGVLSTVKTFVAERGGDAASIKPKTKLLGDGYVDSFALIELIGALETSLGLPLSDGALIPEDFETVEVLFKRLTEIREG